MFAHTYHEQKAKFSYDRERKILFLSSFLQKIPEGANLMNNEKCLELPE